MKNHIFIVGKPDPHGSLIAAIRENGYNVGIFLDTKAKLKKPEEYDTVINFDFSDFEHALASLPARSELPIEGLLCTYENYIVSKALIAKHYDLPALEYDSAVCSTDKQRMRQAFMDYDPSITPRFALVNNQEELLAFAKTASYPLMLKPTNLVKSLLVSKCDNEAELLANFAYAEDNIQALYEQYNIYGRKPQLIVEEYVTGALCSIAAFVDKTGTPHFCEGIASLVNAHDIGMDDNYLYSRTLPANIDPDLQARLFEVATKGVRALGMRSTPAHVELIYNEDEVKLVEIGARIGGYRPRMYEAVYGINLHESEIRLAIGQQPQLQGEFKKYVAVYELFPDVEGRFTRLTNSRATLDESAYAYFSVKKKPGDLIGPAKNGYKAAAIIIAAHADFTEFSALCEAVDHLRVEVES